MLTLNFFIFTPKKKKKKKKIYLIFEKRFIVLIKNRKLLTILRVCACNKIISNVSKPWHLRNMK
jgi:hypothetical protein